MCASSARRGPSPCASARSAARVDQGSVSYSEEGIVRLCYEREHAIYDDERGKLGKRAAEMSGSCTVGELPIEPSFAVVIDEVRNFVRLSVLGEAQRCSCCRRYGRYQSTGRHLSPFASRSSSRTIGACFRTLRGQSRPASHDLRPPASI